jgi:acyl-CoA synthetase (AMP-forming)/AMP-acid ligase II
MPPDEPIGRVLEAVTAVDAGRAALIVGETTVTYGELDAAVRSCAAALRSAGVDAGWRIPLVDDATLLSVATLLGATLLGAAAALMNPRLTPDELRVLIKVAEAAPVGVAGADYAGLLTEAGQPAVLGAGELLGDHSGGRPPARNPDPDEAAVLLFTSGTTGTPKSVPLPHGMVASRVAAYSPTVDPVPAVALMCVPFVHIGGMLGLLVALAKGSTTVVQTRFDAGEWLALVERHRVNTSFLVPTMLHRILEHPDLATTDLGSLKALTYGAAPASPELIRAALAALPGVALANTFGQTETMGSITLLGPGDHSAERLSSVGRPLPGVEVRIVDPVTLDTVPPGEVGELWVKSENSVIPDAQVRDPAIPAGWFRTGDMVSEDGEGYLYPAGRLADTINRGGEKFSPSEVEAVVRAYPAVQDVAVFGVPDPEMGNRVGAAIVVSEPVTADQLRQFCTGRIANFKIPEQVVMVEEIPYNDFGKVDRKLLRARFEHADRDRPERGAR